MSETDDNSNKNEISLKAQNKIINYMLDGQKVLNENKSKQQSNVMYIDSGKKEKRQIFSNEFIQKTQSKKRNKQSSSSNSSLNKIQT